MGEWYRKGMPYKGAWVEFLWGISMTRYLGRVLSERPYILDYPAHVYHGRMVLDIAPEFIKSWSGEWVRTAYGTPDGSRQGLSLGVVNFEGDFPDAKVVSTPFRAKVRARTGLLLGGVFEIESSAFSSYQDAVKWGDCVIKANIEAGRDPMFDGIWMLGAREGMSEWTTTAL